jgi:hypothetical protein
MGQGLHTKVAQVAAAALGLPLSAVYIAETATDKVPNASPTAASASSDMYGGAGAVLLLAFNASSCPAICSGLSLYHCKLLKPSVRCNVDRCHCACSDYADLHLNVLSRLLG